MTCFASSYVIFQKSIMFKILKPFLCFIFYVLCPCSSVLMERNNAVVNTNLFIIQTLFVLGLIKLLNMQSKASYHSQHV